MTRLISDVFGGEFPLFGLDERVVRKKANFPIQADSSIARQFLDLEDPDPVESSRREIEIYYMPSIRVNNQECSGRASEYQEVNHCGQSSTI
jgi:hypothetical protein